MRAPVRFMLRRSVARIASEMAWLYWRVLKRESGRPMWPMRPSWSKARRSSGWNMTMTAMTMKKVALRNSQERRMRLKVVDSTPTTASRMRPTRIWMPCVPRSKRSSWYRTKATTTTSMTSTGPRWRSTSCSWTQKAVITVMVGTAPPSEPSARTGGFRPARHLLDGHEVGQDLAGVRAVGEAVDDRLLGRPRQLLEVLVRAQPGHRPVDVAVEDPRGVGDGLPDPELDVVLAERRGRAAEPCDADLEGDPGAVRRLLEEHGEMAALEGPLAPPAGLDRMGQVEGGSELGPVEVGQVEEVASLERIQWSDHDRSLPQSRGSMSSPATTGEIWRSRTESNSGRRVRRPGAC